MNNNPSTSPRRYATFYLPEPSIKKFNELAQSLGLNKSHKIDLLINNFDTLLAERLNSLDLSAEARSILLRRLTYL